MQIRVNDCSLELVRGDVTLQEVDAVVNAANSRLAGGGGVDGAIHSTGGPAIKRETDTKYSGGCPTGSAVISGGGKLAAKHVIHAVGPVWNGGASGEADLLAAAYRRCLELALEHDCTSVAFPSLSTGAYRFPTDQAARIALSTVVEFMQANDRPELVRFVLFTDGILGAFSAALEEFNC